MTTTSDIDAALDAKVDEQWNELLQEGKDKLFALMDNSNLQILTSQAKQNAFNIIKADILNQESEWKSKRKKQILDNLLSRI